MRIERSGEVAPAKAASAAPTSASELLARLSPGKQLSEAQQHDALKHLQSRHGLEPTGLPTAATMDALQREVDWLAHERAAEQEPELPVRGRDSAKPGPPRFDPHQARVEGQLRRPTATRAMSAEARRILRQEGELLRTLTPRMRSLPRALRAVAVDHLARVPAGERADEQQLLARVLTGPNADRVASMLRSMPTGTAADVRRALIHGVGIPRGSGREGAEGLLGTEHADLVLRSLEGLTDRDRAAVQTLLDQVGDRAPRTERSLILKAVAARWQEFRGGRAAEAMEELRSFAEAIRGHERRGLVRATSAVSITTGGFGVMQMHPSACTQVAAMIVRAEADPAFAWRLTATLDTLGPRANRSANDGDAEATQRKLANGRYGVGLLSVPLALMGSEPNRGYVRRGPATPSADYMRQRMVELASSGVDVPIGVETVPGGDGHAMVVTDARVEGGEAILKITDPSGGVSRWVPAGALDDFQIGMGRVRLRAWMDSARGTRDTVTTDADGQPVATRDLFEPL